MWLAFMHTRGGILTLWSAVLALCALGFDARAGSFQTFQPASIVLGQPDFTSNGSSLSPSFPGGLGNPSGIAIDPTTGKVFVSDTGNSRVLRFSSVAAWQKNGALPEAVFGQPNFTGYNANQGMASPTAATMWFPEGLFVDSTGRLWVADSGNNRVLFFVLASLLGNDPPADGVLSVSSAADRTEPVPPTTAATDLEML